jgi:hypothetical protein
MAFIFSNNSTMTNVVFNLLLLFQNGVAFIDNTSSLTAIVQNQSAFIISKSKTISPLFVSGKNHLISIIFTNSTHSLETQLIFLVILLFIEIHDTFNNNSNKFFLFLFDIANQRKLNNLLISI